MKRIFANGDSQTFTVAELRDFLNNFPDNMPVIAVWEGQCAGIRPEMFSKEELVSHYAETLLSIDVESFRNR